MKEASRKQGQSGQILLQLLERRLRSISPRCPSVGDPRSLYAERPPRRCPITARQAWRFPGSPSCQQAV
jgi:hypothetical protein